MKNKQGMLVAGLLLCSAGLVGCDVLGDGMPGTQYDYTQTDGANPNGLQPIANRKETTSTSLADPNYNTPSTASQKASVPVSAPVTTKAIPGAGPTVGQ